MKQEIPSYAKFLKEIMTRKRRLEDRKMIALMEECSAIIQNKLPLKLKDPRSFSIPCTIGNIKFYKALCALLTDLSIAYPLGVLENVLIKFQKFIIPVDFVVLDMEEDMSIPIILGRPFSATAGTIIDVKNGKLKFQVGEEEVVFNLNEMEKYPSFTDHTCSIGTIEMLTQELNRVNLDVDPLELCLMNIGMQEQNEEEIEALAQYLYAQPPYRKGHAFENLGQGKRFPPPWEIEAPRLEFKPLSSHLKYEFFGENETLPVIVKSFKKAQEGY
ncbi:uncharacterized protein LOC113780372 [Coffea eugenioides]|uniref:uncharacterized protein LOC113780372 n=1 Tax=Coffea eugenioides TaxID=49369 RepID=UPI000F6159A3|nr:uncharacterized protein LOC113780372 [Coffea eugenioides]